MRIFLMAAVLALLHVVLAIAAEPNAAATAVPVEAIWALDMPGTRDIRELDAPADPIVETVVKEISEIRRHDCCYAVRGEGGDALRDFLRVRTRVENWHRLPAAEPISLVFFTRPTHDAVVVDRVERTGARFRLFFRFAPRDAADASPGLAVIPVGRLPIGQYAVTPERVPAKAEDLAAGFEEPSPREFSELDTGVPFFVTDDPDAVRVAERMEIPLDAIWGYGIPGTRDLREVPTGDASVPTVDKLLVAIRESWRHDVGIAVDGEGAEALSNFVRKRIGKQERSEVRADAPVSLAFYTGGVGWHILLEKIVRQGNVVTIQYRPIPHHEASSTSHLALIPVGQLPSGKYRVVVEQLPMDEKYEKQGFRQPPRLLRERISGSFTFIAIKRR